MRFPVADGHCDYLYGVVQRGYEMRQPKREQTVVLDDLFAGGTAIQFFACWTDMALRTPPLHQCIAMIDAYERMLAAHSEFTKLTKSFTPDSGKIATVLTIEGGEVIDGSLAMLRTMKRLGVAAMTLTWNDANELSGAAMSKNRRGLTQLGKEVIDEMCRLRIAIDVSHLSDHGIDDILARTTLPIFASHSNARAVCDSPRALCDDHIREIALHGGVMGVNYYYQQLCSGERACIRDIVAHIVHMVKIGGVACCALGSDFDGMQRYPVDLKSPRDVPALLDALAAEGFSDADIYRIAYQNLRDYIVQFV